MLTRTLATALLVTANVVYGAAVAPASRQVVAAAAHAPGVADTFWRTELVVHNPGPARATLTLRLIPARGVAAPPDVTLDAPLEALATLVLDDVVGELFAGATGGAIVVSAVDEHGDGAPVVAASRTYTTVAGSERTYGQGFAAVAWPEDGTLSDGERILTDVEVSDAFRTNLGVVNLAAATEAVFQVDLLAPNGTVTATEWLTVPPATWLQTGSLLAELGASGAQLTVVVRPVAWTPADAACPDFVVYGSKVDNLSGDPTTLEAADEIEGWGLARHRILPAAASSAGEDGSHWTTDVTVHNADSLIPTVLQVSLIPTATAAGLPARNLSLPIRPGQTMALTDVIGVNYPDHALGGLVLSGWNGGSRFVDLRVASRTWTPAGDGGGTYGQAIPAVARTYGADPLAVVGLEESDAFRTNLGLVNASTNLRQTLEITLLAPDGSLAGTVVETLEPWTHLQVNRVLERVGASGEGFTAVVRLTAQENLQLAPSDPWEPIFLAYGSRVDRASNDPTYLAAVPLATPAPTPTWYDFSHDAPWYRCPTEEPPAAATVVTAFDRAYHYFGAEDRRSIVSEVDFPADGEWEQIGLRLHLECPESGLCDAWDRTGSLQLVLNPDAPEADWQYLELARYITPYRIGMCQYVDLTRLAPVLRGRQTLVSWIDTWVGPGHSSGEGWRITHDVVFYPGASSAPDEVVNIWGRRTVTIGSSDPTQSVDAQTEPVAVAIPADATRVEARLLATGHAFGNTDNCAEFCVLRQDLVVNGATRSAETWRTDCEYNPTSPQSGTWTYDRNGWCPGAVVVGNLVDLTDLAPAGQTVTLDFDIRDADGEVYVNTSPGEYAPFEWVSLQLLVYRD